MSLTRHLTSSHEFLQCDISHAFILHSFNVLKIKRAQVCALFQCDVQTSNISLWSEESGLAQPRPASSLSGADLHVTAGLATALVRQEDLVIIIPLQLLSLCNSVFPSAWYVARSEVRDDQWGWSHFNWQVASMYLSLALELCVCRWTVSTTTY